MIEGICGFGGLLFMFIAFLYGITYDGLERYKNKHSEQDAEEYAKGNTVHYFKTRGFDGYRPFDVYHRRVKLKPQPRQYSRRKPNDMANFYKAKIKYQQKHNEPLFK